MDPVTHMALGAAVGHFVGGRRLGWVAPVAGAAIAILPDLDIFWPLPERAVEYYTVHRGLTHSLFFGPVIGGLIGYGAARIHRAVRARRGRAFTDDDARNVTKTWVLLSILVLVTHVLNDFATIYGTQLFAPFSDRQFGLPAVPVIDPVYTLILLAGLFLAWRRGWARPQARGMTLGALVLSTGYLLLALAQNERARDLVFADPGAQERIVTDYEVTTTMFSPWLRRIVTREPDSLHVGYISTLSPRAITWTRIAREPQAEALADAALATPEGVIYRRFARGLIHPHIVEDAERDLYLRIGDMRYASPGAALRGMWGVEWPLAESADGLVIAGEGLRFMQRTQADAHVLRALFQAKAGQDNDVF